MIKCTNSLQLHIRSNCMNVTSDFVFLKFVFNFLMQGGKKKSVRGKKSPVQDDF